MSVRPVCERIRSRTGEPRKLLKLTFPRRLITLNGMKASEELTEEQARQVSAAGLGGSCAALILAFTVVIRHRACIRRVLQESEWEGRAVVKLQVECCS